VQSSDETLQRDRNKEFVNKRRRRRLMRIAVIVSP